MRKAFLIAAGCLLILGGFLTVVSTPIITFILPESFASTARILPGVTMPPQLATEIEKIQSKDIVFPVITNLNLNKVWAQKFKEEDELPTMLTYTILRKKLEVRQAGKSLLIEIKAYSEDKNEAAAIANSIAETYQHSALVTKTPDGKSAIQIVDKAEPALRPARPNKPLNIILGCGIGVIFGAVGILLLLVSAKRPASPPIPATPPRLVS